MGFVHLISYPKGVERIDVMPCTADESVQAMRNKYEREGQRLVERVKSCLFQISLRPTSIWVPGRSLSKEKRL